MYFNRELSWLLFNERVLMQSYDHSIGLFERLKFLGIYASNLDEFYMVRVSGIIDQMKVDYTNVDFSGYTPEETYEDIEKKVRQLNKKVEKSFEDIKQELKDENVCIIKRPFKSKVVYQKSKKYFENELFPVLTPMAVDFGRPFPFIRNRSMYVVVKALVEHEFKLGIVQIPDIFDRFYIIEDKQVIYYIPIEEIILEFLDQLFVGQKIVNKCLFRVIRDGELELDNDAGSDLLGVIEKAVKKRVRGLIIRLEISSDVDDWILKHLCNELDISQEKIYETSLWLDYSCFTNITKTKKRATLLDKPYKPKHRPFMDKKNIYSLLNEQDIFLHHPYESFNYIVAFIKMASEDPKVLAIKQTLYRVSGNSEIVKSLERAADLGKQVTVLVELQARFDEENNIEWAKKLEKHGVHVIYGVYGLKTHSKITLVVRKERNKIKRYIHLGTGNYNDITAKIYTDMGYMTSRENLGIDASLYFNMVSGFTNEVETQYLVVSPYQLRKKLYSLIEDEITAQKNGKKGHIIAKMNALVDKNIVEKLYEASNAGVKIELIIRGICVLKPGVEGKSENITVKSIIGEFLEHSRIFYFANQEESSLFLSSADWMKRNLNKRLELMFPILDPMIEKRICLILKLYLKDTRRSWVLDKKGHYKPMALNEKSEIDCHKILKNLSYDDDEEFIDKLSHKLGGVDD